MPAEIVYFPTFGSWFQYRIYLHANISTAWYLQYRYTVI
jgi:hypothetical protein